ncbi:MAG TPA: site-specific DNA-methyltransferase [Candidatus Acidoferrales bacterium]|nr:site-specific DNA-methyltransferase [Candidatus Acidoferrales bacterium]
MISERATEITTPTPAVDLDSSKEKLKGFLKKQFHLDSPPIDLGRCYAISCHRLAIENFIERELTETVDREFQKYKIQNIRELREKTENFAKQFGGIILENNDVKESSSDDPLAKEFFQLKKQLIDAEITKRIENQAYDDLLTFFTRYYQKDNFSSEPTYFSDSHSYVIPYIAHNGKLEAQYFIHKKLKPLLEKELDYFLKSEVINLENLEPRQITRIRVVEAVAKKIIGFLVQIEELQKKLWEKKKLVVRTNFIITTDLIPKELHDEILVNQVQLNEWKKLGFGIQKKRDLSDKHLPVDTKHFPDAFREGLLEKLSKNHSLDDMIDGIIIRSENFHALQLLLEKYRGKVKCIYIDPPYNTGSNEFLFKDAYKHSAWVSMMIDRMQLSKQYFNKDGVIFANINDVEFPELKQAMRMAFGEEAEIPTFVWKKKGTSTNVKGAQVSSLTDYILAFGGSTSINPRITPVSKRKYPKHDRLGNYRTTIIEKKHAGVYARRTMTYKILGHKPRPGKRWQIGEELARELEAKGRFIIEDGVVKRKIYDFEDKDTISANPNLLLDYGSTDSASTMLANMFGKAEVFSNPKPVELLQHLITLSTRNAHDFVVDYFAGSGTTGHAVINLNRNLPNAGRRYILVEKGDWFESVLLPRIKKAVFSDGWKAGKPIEGKGLSHFVKYQYLEQYEDTIHNLPFNKTRMGEDISAKAEQSNKYVKNLQQESNEIPSLLGVESFQDPESYKLKIISSGDGEEVLNVDLVETFNYLLGLHVNAYRFLQVNDRKYTVVIGEKAGLKICVVWRATKNLDPNKDRDAIKGILCDYQPKETYVNGESSLEGCKAIEPEFRTLMEG